MKIEIMAEIDNKTAKIGCFARIKNEILMLMEKDNFERFKKQKEFQVEGFVVNCGLVVFLACASVHKKRFYLFAQRPSQTKLEVCTLGLRRRSHVQNG
jgi:hypothetical protein